MQYEVLSSGNVSGLSLVIHREHDIYYVVDINECREYMNPTPHIITCSKWGTFYTSEPDEKAQSSQNQLDEYIFNTGMNSKYCNGYVYSLSQSPISYISTKLHCLHQKEVSCFLFDLEKNLKDMDHDSEEFVKLKSNSYDNNETVMKQKSTGRMMTRKESKKKLF